MGSINTIRKIGIFSILLYPICHGIVNRFYDTEPGDTDWLEDNLILRILIFISDVLYSLVFPIFGFYFLSLIQHTQNRLKHAFFLLLTAAISELPYNFVVQQAYIDKRLNNPLFDLFVAYVVILLYSTFSYKFRNFSNISNDKLFLMSLITAIIFTITISLSYESSTEKYAIFIATFLSVYLASKRYNRGKELSCDLIVLSLSVFAAKSLRTRYGCHAVVAVSLMFIFRQSRWLAAVLVCGVLALRDPFEIASFLSVFLVVKNSWWRGSRHPFWFYALYPSFLALLALVFSLAGIGDSFSLDDLADSFND